VGTAGLAGDLVTLENDLTHIPLLYLTGYTMSSGTSFAAPHVAGAAALMLDANPTLSPDEIKTILQLTATPMLDYSRYEVGAGRLNAYAAVRAASLGLQYGRFRGNFLGSHHSFERKPVVGFSGRVAPGEVYTTSFTAPADAALAMVEVLWTGIGSLPNNLAVTVSRNGQVFSSKPATLLAGSSAQRSGVTINDPQPGMWTVAVTNTSPLPPGTSQQFAGAIELFSAGYNGESDVDRLPAAEREIVMRALRRGLVAPDPDGRFMIDSLATRLNVARALMLGAELPQHLPDSPTFGDVQDGDVFVESVVGSPYGNLLNVTGSQFSPQSGVDRLTFAVASVKALGIQPPLTAGLINPGLSDWNTIPLWARPYVATALSLDLVAKNQESLFRPSQFLTRAELAHGAVGLQSALP
jgi:serine protease AprX